MTADGSCSRGAADRHRRRVEGRVGDDLLRREAALAAGRGDFARRRPEGGPRRPHRARQRDHRSGARSQQPAVSEHSRPRDAIRDRQRRAEARLRRGGHHRRSRHVSDLRSCGGRLHRFRHRPRLWRSGAAPDQRRGRAARHCARGRLPADLGGRPHLRPAARPAGRLVSVRAEESATIVCSSCLRGRIVSHGGERPRINRSRSASRGPQIRLKASAPRPPVGEPSFGNVTRQYWRTHALATVASRTARADPPQIGPNANRVTRRLTQLRLRTGLTISGRCVSRTTLKGAADLKSIRVSARPAMTACPHQRREYRG